MLTKVCVFSGGSRSFERGVADLTERYQNNPRQNRPGDSFVPFLDFKLKRHQIGGWLATQSTPPGSAPGLDVQSNSQTLCHQKYMENSWENMHVDTGA